MSKGEETVAFCIAGIIIAVVIAWGFFHTDSPIDRVKVATCIENRIGGNAKVGTDWGNDVIWRAHYLGKDPFYKVTLNDGEFSGPVDLVRPIESCL